MPRSAAQQPIEEGLRSQQLADRPDLGARRVCRLALLVIGVDAKVRRLDIGEGIEFELERRMAGAHDAVVDRLVLAAHVAMQAQARARHRVGQRIQAEFDVLCMRVAGHVRAEPALCAAVAGLAAHAFAHRVTTAAQLLGNVVGVTGQAFRRGSGILDAEVCGDALARWRQQQLVGIGVRIVALPQEVFVLQHWRIIERPLRSVAVAAGAGRNADVLPLVLEGLQRCGHDGTAPAQQCHGREAAKQCAYAHQASPFTMCRDSSI
jgi:hypothetical protein